MADDTDNQETYEPTADNPSSNTSLSDVVNAIPVSDQIKQTASEKINYWKNKLSGPASGLAVDSGAVTVTAKSSSSEENANTTNDKDLQLGTHSKPDKDKLTSYLSSMGALSDAADYIISLDTDDHKIDPILLTALSVWQTRNGTTSAVTDYHNPGCIPNKQENTNLADLKSGYEAMIKQIDARTNSESNKWLSSLRFDYVTKYVEPDTAAGLEDADQKSMGATTGSNINNSLPKEAQGLDISSINLKLNTEDQTRTTIAGVSQEVLTGAKYIIAYLKSIDDSIDPLISGGSEVGYHASTGYHEKGLAVDISWDNITDNETYQKGAAFAKNFFTEVLTNEGSGLHIHCGNPKGATADPKLTKLQLWWYHKLCDIVDDIYEKVLGAKPAWQQRDISNSPANKNSNSPSAKGVRVTNASPHHISESHTDIKIVKLPENKTYAEPVYPDLITVGDYAPEWIKTVSTIKQASPLSIFNLSDTTDQILNKISSSMSTNGVKVTIASGTADASSNTNQNSTSSDQSQSNSTNANDIAKSMGLPQGTVFNLTGASSTTDKAQVTTADPNKKTDVVQPVAVPDAAKNSVNQTTVTQPYVAGQKISTTQSDSALNDINQLTGGQLDSILGSQNDALARQIVYDPSKHRTSFKSIARGKPANNNDAFPVDLKIEELELHYPHDYIHSITVCPWDKELATQLLEHASAAEKRTAKLENNLATVMRYLYALGSRVTINCVYYGGTSQYEKYKCIRCLKDDRIDDGQLMSIDQCISCTRFEPVLGQCYEILNDKGANLAQILDDNQMGYCNMQDYTDFVKTDEYQTQLSDFSTGASNVKTRDPNAKDFANMWPQGIKMNWKLVPVEEQKPHIGWRQSINDDGSYLKTHKLSSYQYSAENNGTGFGKNAQMSVWIVNKNAMDSCADSSLSQLIASGKNFSLGNIQDSINGMATKDWMKGIKTLCKSTGVKMSPIAIGILSIIANDPGSTSTIISKVKQLEDTLSQDGIDNEIITAACYALPNGINYFLSSSDSCISKKKDAAQENKDSESPTPTPTNQVTAPDRGTINKWRWVDFAPSLVSFNMSNLDMCPKICYTFSDLNKYANDAITGIEEGMAEWEGKEMPNGSNGCVEAVVRIGSHYSDFLKNELANNIAYVPTLVSDAQSAGVSVISYDQSKLEPGDVIVYSGQEHVVIATGDGFGYVGNSSSKLQVVRGSDYTQMGWDPPITPDQIIKTSQA